MKPVIANKHSAILDSNDYLYAQLVVLFDLFNQINPGSNWSSELQALIESCPHISLSAMSFPEQWWEEPFWSIV